MRSRYALWLGLSGAALSLLAIANMPYGYYTFNRVALTGLAVLLSISAVKSSASGWLWILVPIVILWNPAFPIHLERVVWAPLNLLAAAGLVACGLLLSRRAGPQNSSDSPSSSA